jgi:hypothetical protein
VGGETRVGQNQLDLLSAATCYYKVVSSVTEAAFRSSVEAQRHKMPNPSKRLFICNRKSSSLVDAAAGKGLQGALAFGGREGNLVLGPPAQLFARLAVVLVRLLWFGFGSAVDVHVYHELVSL